MNLKTKDLFGSFILEYLDQFRTRFKKLQKTKSL